ncbi:NAD-dependent DNA ligase [Prochlorococcus marinus]|uniref:NAD-dependent DNA ligase n=1 Tax=Prochlorococcus marinus TaxID=1219 RepID=UPI0022B50474|nr:NAD-dependent DNA ligase [Prochlorococcus marinus]
MALNFPIDIYMRLLGLDKDCFSSWWAKLPEGSTIVVQPKIDGYAIGLRYKYGQLVEAYSREDSEIIENIRHINAIPLSIDDTLKVEVELEGILYSPSTNSKISIEQVLSNSISEIGNNTSLLFLAFHIFCSNSDELSDLTQLQNWGFEVPITLRTDDPRQVKRWHSQWIKKELFSNLPTNGIVAKCNSSMTKNILGASTSYPNWALALTS